MKMQLSESLALKVVSLILSLILWVTILGFKREEIKKNLRFEPRLPPGMVIVNTLPTNIQFTLTGPRILLKDVEKKLQPLQPDFSRTRESTLVFSISEDLVGELPSGVRVTGFSPPNVLILLEEVVERYIPVKPTFVGKVADHWEILPARVSPLKVAVSGPKSLVNSLEFIGTESIPVDGLSGSRELVAEVQVDSARGLQLSRDKVVKVVVSTRKVQ